MSENTFEYERQQQAGSTGTGPDQAGAQGSEGAPQMSVQEALQLVPKTTTWVQQAVKQLYTPPPINMQDEEARKRGEWEPGYVSIPVLPPNVSIDENAQAAKALWNPIEFYNRVKTGGMWDYKRYGTNEEPNPYEPGGNFHFGVVANAYGIPEGIAKRGAGMYQIETTARQTPRNVF